MCGLKLIMPAHVLRNDDIHGLCISDEKSPRLMVNNKLSNPQCRYIIEKQIITVGEGTNKSFCIDFVIKNVTTTCQYTCGIGSSHDTKIVVVAGT